VVNTLVRSLTAQLESRGRLPEMTTYRFQGDYGPEAPSRKQAPAHKLTARTIVTRAFSRFEAREVIRRQQCDTGAVIHRSPELAAVVPKGQRYGYDLISYVGLESLLHGRRLQAIQTALLSEGPRCEIPLSTLFELQRKFLFYLGALQRQAAGDLRECFHQRGGASWLIDGTLEPGTPVFFGILEAQEGLLLSAWKIATENTPDIVEALKDTARQYGTPVDVLHDLSDVMAQACETALPGVPHYVCDYHLLADVGEDLYRAPQAALSKLMRSLKLQARLKEQRRGQTDWFRQNLAEPDAALLLKQLLTGTGASPRDSAVLGREVLLAFHAWILDYASDGRRLGFPFDPYLLYFHRRVTRAQRIITELLRDNAVQRHAPKVLHNFASMLTDYVSQPKVVAAATHYEQAAALFGDLRTALRFSAHEDNPMRHAYRLESAEQPAVREALVRLRAECQQRALEESDPQQRALHEIVLVHLDRYGDSLVAASHDPKGQATPRQRTTNSLEAYWGHGKQLRRHVHGRKRLTQDFQSLPPEYMLVPNLENHRYVERVLGSLDCLPAKLAGASKHAGVFSHWLKKQRPLNLGRLPKRILRQENFVEQLVCTYHHQCDVLE